MSRVRIKLDLTKLAVSEARIKHGAETGVRLATEHVLTEANKRVPHDEGTLERSGATGVETAGTAVTGSVSYDTPYAATQHERLDLHHDGKGEAKWLETTLAQESDAVGQIIATAIKGMP